MAGEARGACPPTEAGVRMRREAGGVGAECPAQRGAGDREGCWRWASWTSGTRARDLDGPVLAVIAGS
jgi:hypothetical protein